MDFDDTQDHATEPDGTGDDRTDRRGLDRSDSGSEHQRCRHKREAKRASVAEIVKATILGVTKSKCLFSQEGRSAFIWRGGLLTHRANLLVGYGARICSEVPSSVLPVDLFTSARAKVDRARKHFDRLNEETAVFFNNETYELMEEDDPEPGIRRAVLTGVSPLPYHWPLIIGDALHNLRSALDHLISALTISYSGKSLTHTEFPVMTDPDRFDQRSSKTGEPAFGSGLYKIRGLHPTAQDHIRSLQPFAVAGSGRVAFIEIVHELNIQDKHRGIHVVRGTVENLNVVLRRDLHPVSTNFTMAPENGVVLARWMPVSGDDPTHPYFDLTLKCSLSFGANTPHVGNSRVADVGEKICMGVDNVIRHMSWVDSTLS